MSASLELVWRGVELSMAQGLEMGAGFKAVQHCLRTIVVGSCTSDSERTIQA